MVIRISTVCRISCSLILLNVQLDKTISWEGPNAAPISTLRSLHCPGLDIWRFKPMQSSVASVQLKKIYLYCYFSKIVFGSWIVCYALQVGGIIAGLRPGCECVNPWSGVDFYEHEGNPDYTCESDQFCYVDCNSSCPDREVIFQYFGRVFVSLTCFSTG